jgi:hypothetical protein
MTSRQGVYFLANDHVLDLAVTFLNSFRKFNPSTPLCLVPFAADITELTRLARKYGYTIYDDEKVLYESDVISTLFHGEIRGHYRKLAMWSGMFENFLYFDVDAVVLRNVDCAFPLTSEYDFIVAESDSPHLFKWVWKDSVHAAGKLSSDQVAFSANTGFIASRRGALSMRDVRRALPEAVSLKRHMNLQSEEQPFLNFLFVTSGMRYTSLNNLHEREGGSRIPVQVCRAGPTDEWKFTNGQAFLNDEPLDLLSIHWAGLTRLGLTRMTDRDLWEHYHDLETQMLQTVPQS